MDPYAGFEPSVGEIRALRTFRIGPGGCLHSLFSDTPWQDGANVATCRRERENVTWHGAPDPACTCGFYAYGTARAATEYPHSRHVLAVVSCWGRVIAGTRGLRAERCRVEALWLSGAVPDALVAALRERYPSVAVYTDRDRMLAEHPLTPLDCYEAVPSRPRFPAARTLTIAALLAALLGVLPADWFGGKDAATLVWSCLAALFLVVALTRGWRKRDVAAYRQRLLSLAVVLWMLAPFAGLAGLLLLRLPLLELGAFLAVQHWQLYRAASRFPADIG
jgi:hypothetical protein